MRDCPSVLTQPEVSDETTCLLLLTIILAGSPGVQSPIRTPSRQAAPTATLPVLPTSAPTLAPTQPPAPGIPPPTAHAQPAPQRHAANPGDRPAYRPQPWSSTTRMRSSWWPKTMCSTCARRPVQTKPIVATLPPTATGIQLTGGAGSRGRSLGGNHACRRRDRLGECLLPDRAGDKRRFLRRSPGWDNWWQT